MTEGKSYTVIDLFAGCGGLSLGLYQAGWQGLFAIEKSSNAFETLRFNLINRANHFSWPQWLPVEHHDINKLIAEHSDDLKALQGKVNLVAGGPPCQGFSMAGKRMENDVRNQLVFSYVEFIRLVGPDLLLFENVKGFTSAFKSSQEDSAVPYSQIVTQKLHELGYDVKGKILDFSEYGVPQKRKRFILVGVRNGQPGSAENFFAKLDAAKESFLEKKGLPVRTTVQEALSDLLKSNGSIPTSDRHGFESAKYGAIQSPYQALMRKGVRQDTEPQSHSFAHHSPEKVAVLQNILSHYPNKGVRISGDERATWGIRQRGIIPLDPYGLSPTITNMPDDYIHYCEPRNLTVRECARIQSFPDWYHFKSKYTTGGKLRKVEVPRYSQVGNAIPPLFAEQAGEVLKTML